ncbi:hemin uptake protein HemP [Kaistia terrae]|jgi:hemin uptake protein HemP|uniref:Hemin uptake protein HemP n=1 Tax=Kaistia terrae TaxID=537017 RepID=A0ABW0Q4I4_9HYPH|nr:hemin uptake protein HemP [Kaistia terrae]MCX5580944.1 hemin uptake protein HemP [Kaistia terrae]
MHDITLAGVAQESPVSGSGPRVISSGDLLNGAREIIIRHVGEDYRLRLTRAGKLILNK